MPVMYQIEVRWLSQGRVLKQFYKLLHEIDTFLQTKSKTVAEVTDPERKTVPSFLTDVTELLKGPNLQLQDNSMISILM